MINLLVATALPSRRNKFNQLEARFDELRNIAGIFF